MDQNHCRRDGYTVLADALAAGEPDDRVVREYLCIHFPHKLSDLMHETLAHPAIVDALTGLIGPNVKAMQSMLFIPTRDRSLIAAWDRPGRRHRRERLPVGPARLPPPTGRHGLRRALVNHYMSAESLLPWFLPPDGVTMGRADHRDVVLVAGTDPYAYKGTTDLMRPHVRPDGQGGCAR